jgi:hypothetical protein
MRVIIISLVWLAFSSHTSFKSMLKHHRVKHVDIVYNQARLESANFTSRGYKELNNPFGFTYKGRLMKFDSMNHSIAYLKSFQVRKMKPNENYYDFLKRVRWATDKFYIQKLKQF